VSQALRAARAALGEGAWLVGGALRDQLLGRPVEDVDIAVAGEAREAARAVAREARGTPFNLSDAWGAWRVVGPAQAWQVDITPLRDGHLAADLAARDLTVNALAEPLAGGDVVDPHGGLADLKGRLLRMVSERSFPDDPLRVARLGRLAVELGFDTDPGTASAARASAGALTGVAGERVFGELRRVLALPAPQRAVSAWEELGVLAAVLPELVATRGVEQSDYHHLDVFDHTLEVLARVVELEADPAPLGEHAAAVQALLAEPLGDDMTRGEGLRLGALLHDVAKPPTRDVTPQGRVTFIGHDDRGAEVTRAVLGRLRASERLRVHVAALTRHHLRLGFLVHERPLSPRTVHRYLRACDPVAVDVTVLSVADRLATRGRGSDAAIAAHLEVARELLAAALRWRAGDRPRPLVRGDELTAELGIRPGPEVGRLLAALEEDQYAGDVSTREEALARARELLAG
jgi:poly(A) polymerase